MNRVILLFFSFVILACNQTVTDTDQVRIDININEVVEHDFLGIGVQISAYPWYDLSQEDWEKVVSRLDYMKMPYTRIMVDMTDFFQGLNHQGDPIYSFKNSRMMKLYKLLDYCQDKSIDVLLGQWGAANTARHNPDQDWNFAIDSKTHALISTDYIEHIVVVKGYTCVKWYNLINEPNGNWSSLNGDFDLWKNMILNLHAEMKKRGLTEKVKIAGPDNSGGDWLHKTIRDTSLQKVLDVYEYHLYLSHENDICEGQLEARTRESVEILKNNDPGKPLFLGELGFVDGKNEQDQQRSVYEFWYGLYMSNAAIQLIRGGSSGFMAWYLDDALHYAGDSDGPMFPAEDFYERRKIWGFWNIVGGEHGDSEDENLRPWFYVWSFLSRNFPKGCQTLRVSDTKIEGLKCAAARIPQNDSFDMTVILVNDLDTAYQVNLQIPGADSEIEFAQYNYFDVDKDNKVDSWKNTTDDQGNDILPKPDPTLKSFSPNKGLSIEIKGKGVVLLTSKDPDSLL